MSSTIQLSAAITKTAPPADPSKLSKGAMACLNAMELNTYVQDEIVYKAIAQHTKPTGCRFFSWLANKIKEFVLSIFGRSQWQTARTFIANRALEIAYDKKILPFGNPDLNQRTLETLKKISDRAAEDLLKLALEYNQDHERSTKDLSKILSPLKPSNIIASTLSSEGYAPKSKFLSTLS